jgi:hypothetical protein
VTVALQPITDADLPRVGEFLHRQLNPRLSAEYWSRVATAPWQVEAPNHGFLIEDAGQVVGALLAFYSEREIDGKMVRFCNLGAWCVDEDKRFHSVKMLKAVLAQEGYVFTDLSPSGNVIPLNERLGYTHLDTASSLMPCLPYPTVPGRIRVHRGPAVPTVLTGADARIYRDHEHAAAARHVVLSRGGRNCYVVFRRDRRKNLPLFASLLYVSDPEFFRSAARVFSRHLLLRHGVMLLLAEKRIVKHRLVPSKLLGSNRRKMVKNAVTDLDRIDYLYSELACVAW